MNPHWLQLAAHERPERIAIEDPGGAVSYAELRERAAAASVQLEELGVRPGDLVALALPAGAAFVAALHGCWYRGAVPVPIDLRLAPAEQAARAAGAVLVNRPLRTAPAAASMPSMIGFVPERVAAVLHTSGTTSAPKPVQLTFGNFAASARGSADALGRAHDERWLCPMPLTHVGGLSIPVRSAIYATTAILHGRFDTDAVLGELMDPGRRITIVSLVPTMLARLLDAGLARPPTLRWALLGGGPIAPALLRRAAAAGVPVAPTYGMTEACSQVATFGRPLTGVELTLRGPEHEILVRGPIVAPAARDPDDGWLHTGDLGEVDDLGRLRIVGRKADTIVTGGENVAPAEVEAVLLEHPDVADAGVHARPDPEWGEAVVATVVLENGARADPEALQAFCAGRIARYKVPKTVEFTDALPRTPSGKLLRRHLS
jgi:O-succinylbenzoic acid--CoA ligase